MKFSKVFKNKLEWLFRWIYVLQLLQTCFFISSYMTRTMAPPRPRRIFEKQPLKKAGTPPSFFMILLAQSIDPLYNRAEPWNLSHHCKIMWSFTSPDCIIIRRLTVSIGYAMIPARVSTAKPTQKEKIKLDFLGSSKAIAWIFDYYITLDFERNSVPLV